MAEIPEPIKAILREEGITPACWKRLRDAWPEPPEAAIVSPPVLQESRPIQEESPLIAKCREDLRHARRVLEAATNFSVTMHKVEFCVAPTGCVTLADAEKAMIVAALQHSKGTNKIITAAEQLGIGKTTLYRKLKELGIPRLGDSDTVRARIEKLRNELARLEKLLPEETGGK